MVEKKFPKGAPQRPGAIGRGDGGGRRRGLQSANLEELTVCTMGEGASNRGCAQCRAREEGYDEAAIVHRFVYLFQILIYFHEMLLMLRPLLRYLNFLGKQEVCQQHNDLQLF